VNEKNPVQEGIEYIGRLGGGGVIADADRVAHKVAHEVQKYKIERMGQDAQAIESSKSELAQMSNTGVNKSDELLDRGLQGLRFFDNYLPLYNNWKGAGLDLDKDIYREYRKLYGIDFAAIRRDATSLRSAGDTLHDANAEVESEFRALMSSWSGRASVAAVNHVFKFLELSKDLKEGVDSIQRSTARHVDALESVIRTCSQSTLELYSADCGGQIPPVVEQLIAAARRQSGVALNDLMGTVVDKFGGLLKIGAGIPVIGGAVSPTVDELTKLSNEAKGILDTVFVPAFESKLNKFRQEVCAKTQDDVRGLWSAFNESTGSFRRDPFSDLPLLF
jgi:uncharacterized protein YukE